MNATSAGVDYQDRILACIDARKGVITASHCREQGVPTVYLTRMVRDGRLTRLARGLYGVPDGEYDEFFILQHRFKKTVFSYETALILLGQTDKIPDGIDITVENSYKINNPPRRLSINYVSPDIFRKGITCVLTSYGNPVKIYGYERIVCDFIAHKKNIDPETYVKTIQGYAKYRNKDIHLLWTIARAMRIENRVRDIMEIVHE